MEQSKTLTIEVSGEDRLLIERPELTQKVYFEPSNESVWAKHYFSNTPIFLGIIPKDFVYLFRKKLVTIKSWKINTETNTILLKVTLANSSTIKSTTHDN